MATIHAFNKYLLSSNLISDLGARGWEYTCEHKHGSSLLISSI